MSRVFSGYNRLKQEINNKKRIISKHIEIKQHTSMESTGERTNL